MDTKRQLFWCFNGYCLQESPQDLHTELHQTDVSFTFTSNEIITQLHKERHKRALVHDKDVWTQGRL